MSVDINGAELLDRVSARIAHYVVLPSDHALAAVTLWCAATHGSDRFEHATRLGIHSPEKRCGKTRLLEVVESLSHEPLATTNASVAALFRMIAATEGKPPTLLLDEADRLFGTKKSDEENRDLIGLLNNGFRRGKPTIRCVGPNQVPTPFENYAFAVLAGIGRLPDTIEDRAVNITMRRRMPGETVAKFRLRTDLPAMKKLRAELATWVESVSAELEEPPGNLPATLEDREEDAWEPLIAIADAAGGPWPTKARDSAKALCGEQREADDAVSVNIRLLTDIREVFGKLDEPFIKSADLIAKLNKIEDAPWADWQLNPSKLGHRLRGYGIKTGHNTAHTGRGYRLEDFQDAFSRYIRPKLSEGVQTPESQGKTTDTLEGGGHLKGVQPDKGVRSKTPESQAATPSDTSGRVTGRPSRCAQCDRPIAPGRSVSGATRCSDCEAA